MDALLQKIGLMVIVFFAGVLFTILITIIFRLKLGKPLKMVKKLNSVILQQQLHDMGFLITEKYICTAIEDSERKKELFGKAILGTKSRVIFTCDVTVHAGIDFEKVNVDIDNFKRNINISLPNAVIYGEPTLDIDSLHNVLEMKAVFTKRDGIDEYKAMFSDMQEYAIESANKNGICSKANKNAENMIKSFVYEILLSTEEYKEYKIVVKFT